MSVTGEAQPRKLKAIFRQGGSAGATQESAMVVVAPHVHPLPLILSKVSKIPGFSFLAFRIFLLGYICFTRVGGIHSDNSN
jgi:hypothetical protein